MPRTHLIARPGPPGLWTVGLVAIAADGTRRLAETARDLPTAEAQAWLDARRARRPVADPPLSRYALANA